MSEARSAPSAARIAISLMRTAARASSKFATLAHAMVQQHEEADGAEEHKECGLNATDRWMVERSYPQRPRRAKNEPGLRRLQILRERRHFRLRALRVTPVFQPRPSPIQIFVA